MTQLFLPHWLLLFLLWGFSLSSFVFVPLLLLTIFVLQCSWNQQSTSDDCILPLRVAAPILVKWSCSPSMRSQKHSSLFYQHYNYDTRGARNIQVYFISTTIMTHEEPETFKSILSALQLCCVTDSVVHPPTGSTANVWEMSTSPKPTIMLPDILALWTQHFQHTRGHGSRSSTCWTLTTGTNGCYKYFHSFNQTTFPELLQIRLYLQKENFCWSRTLIDLLPFLLPSQ